jgi:hypothetical protein
MTLLRRIAGLAGLWLLLATAAARAQTPAPEVVKEAAERFDRGVRLFNQGENAGALVEFKRAQELTGDPLILFNIGLVYAEMKRPVDAVDALDRLLNSRATISPEQRQKAQRVRQEQWASIAFLELVTSSPALIEIDGVEMAHTPLGASLRIPAGSHVVGAVAGGFAPLRKEIDIAGGETQKLSFDLVPTDATLGHVTVHSTLPAAGVWIDGKPVGQTPLASTVALAAGAHHLELRRDGYRTAEQDVKIDVGALADVTLDPEIDASVVALHGGNLEIEASEPGATATVDGRPASATEATRLPIGAHHLMVSRAGFVPAERDINIDLGATATVKVRLDPTVETREAYDAHLRNRRIWAWSVTGLGVVSLAVGAVLVTTGRSARDSANTNLQTVNQEFVRFSGADCDPSLQVDQAACSAKLAAANQRVTDANNRVTAGYISGGVGVVAAVVGVVLLVTGDDPNRYDRGPVASGRTVLSGWAAGDGGGLILGGTF